jgi:hypothetical protein
VTPPAGLDCPDLLIRRSGQVVQDCPSWTVRWADIPGPSARISRCPAAWQQCWQQLWRNGLDPRPTALGARLLRGAGPRGQAAPGAAEAAGSGVMATARRGGR